MNIYERLGVPVVVNAKGTATRLSGGLMRPEITAAMVEAAGHCVDIAELQAVASRRIAAVTGAEAGYVASGAAACLLLATAACVTGLDPALMARLPDTAGMKNEVVMVRSQRNFYDHAVRTAGVRIVEVGLPDRFSGAGIRDAEPWEIAAAITPGTAAVFYVADPLARPSLAEVVHVAHRAGVPVIVDAAAQLPPQANLRRFIGEGADLVAFSGGKAIGGPQASGFLCGRRDLVMAAGLQHLDLDVLPELWQPPPALIDRNALPGTPQHGIGRPCKVGKEEIVGLLVALDLFVAEGDAARHARWLAEVKAIRNALSSAHVVIEGGEDITAVPGLVVKCASRAAALEAARKLGQGTPPIHVELARIDQGELLVSPMCLRPGDGAIVAGALQALLQAG